VKEAEPKIGQLEEALKGLIKLVKADRFYPPAHPALKATAKEVRLAFASLLRESDHLAFGVRKEGFFLGDTAVAPANPILQKLALALFARRIHRLMILPDLTSEDLRKFIQCLSLAPTVIQGRGGIQEILSQSRVTTIWVNEIDLDQILARKEEMEKEAITQSGMEGEEQPAPAIAERDRSLEELLKRLQREKDEERYQQLLKELVPLIPPNLTEAGRLQVLKAYTLLCMNASDNRLSETRRKNSLHALNQLTTEETLDFLTALLCSKGLPQNLRENILRILVFLKGKTIRYLMDRLAAERDAPSRRILTEALVRQRSAAVPVLIEYLTDERWYVVRNAVGILGDIRDQDTADHLTPLLGHPDLRVRREAVRALTRIGGAGAVGILLKTLEGNDQDLCRQALLSLGAIKDPAAVPALVALVKRPDSGLKYAEITREAIKALGEIGSDEAVPTLLSILQKRKLWRRRQYDELRTAAALALGEIGSLEPVPALEEAADDRSETVARAAVQALKQLRKGRENGSGTR
jgi:HEAT repeat protein